MQTRAQDFGPAKGEGREEEGREENTSEQIPSIPGNSGRVGGGGGGG